MTPERAIAAPESRRSRTALAAVVALALVLLTLTPGAPAIAAVPAQVSGTVTAVGTGSPIAGVKVFFYASANYYYTVTDSSGHYSITGMADGTYQVRFYTGELTTGSFVSEWWSDQVLESHATDVPLVAGDDATFDAQLATGGTITGRVTGNDGPGFFSIRAYLQDPGNPSVFDQLTDTTPDAGGNYTLRGLAPGTYQITFGDNNQGASGTQYALEAWDNHHYGSGDLVTVVGTGTIPNINAALTVPGAVTVSRLAGADRFETSAAVWSDPTRYPDGMGGRLYVANGFSFADALGAGPAAAQDDAPLMLVGQDSIPDAVRAQIERLAPDEIVMVGGPGALSENVRAQLETLAPTVTRLSGIDRYDTSRQIIEFGFDLTQSADTLVVATGDNFPDALSAGPAVATRFNSPVLLVPGTGSLSAADYSIIDQIDPGIIVIAGGTGVVSPTVQSQLESTGHTVTRVAGADRYATSTAINSYFFAGIPAAYLAVGTGFADALSGAARAASEGSPLWVTPPSCIPLEDMLAMRTSDIDNVILLGGPGALDANVEGLHRC
jgi:putative cell wall-binding protein